MKSLSTPTNAFTRKKTTILAQLSVPSAEYTDASPKGSVDAGIRHLIDDINALAGLVTTSSCAGRVSVYLEGRNHTGSSGPTNHGSEPGDGDDGRDKEEVRAKAAGGKGGGEWLFVSHDPVEGREGSYEGLFGLPAQVTKQDERGVAVGSRLIRFKFEPMVRPSLLSMNVRNKGSNTQPILHVLTASHHHAQLVVQAGMEAGFRETGAVSLLSRGADEAATPMVAVRSMGLSLESLIGWEDDQGRRTCLVTPGYLDMLVRTANERFAENARRIARFQAALKTAFARKEPHGWEDAEARRERKRQEGLQRREQLRKEAEARPADDQVDMGIILQEPDVL